MSETLLGATPERVIPKSHSAWYTQESELRELVEAAGCQQRGTEEICRMCARLALEVPMCQQVKADDTINIDE